MQKKLTRSEQARINGAKSTGPKTQEGRDRCAKANITHGAYAARISTLPHEDQEIYAGIWQAAIDQLNPRNSLEIELVNQYVDWTWRATRLLNAANTEAINRSAGFRLNTPDLAWNHAYIRTITESNSVQCLEREASRCTYNAARVLKQLKDLRAFTVSREASQESVDLMGKITELGAQINPVSPWERIELPSAPANKPIPPRKQ